MALRDALNKSEIHRLVQGEEKRIVKKAVASALLDVNVDELNVSTDSSIRPTEWWVVSFGIAAASLATLSAVTASGRGGAGARRRRLSRDLTNKEALMVAN